MELRHLRYFVAVAEEQNVTRAAARLHVSQPPLSRQIQDLEAELGIDLLQRTGKSVRLTEAGRVFLKEARAVLRRADEAVQAARAAVNGAPAEFHLGYAPSPTAEFLPMVLRKFRAKAPHVRVVLHDLSSPEMLSGLMTGKLHANLMVLPPKRVARGLTFETLWTYPIIIAVPPKHPFTRARAVTIQEVVEQPLVVYSRREFPDYHQMIRRVAGPKLSRRFQLAEECDGVTSLIAAIESGKGVTFIASSIANTAGTRLRYVPLKPEPTPIAVGVAYRSGNSDANLKTFLEVARTVT